MYGLSVKPRGANAYAAMNVESGVMSASPHQLIVLLFDGAQTALRAARLHMQQGNAAEKGHSVSRTLDIVNLGLRAALDKERGGEIAENLDRMYEYIGRLLLQSSVQNDLDKLDQAASLLENIASAWRELAAQHADAPSPAAPRPGTEGLAAERKPGK